MRASTRKYSLFLPIPGLYFYDSDVVEIARNIKPNDRCKLEITAVNNVYLQQGKLSASEIPEGIVRLESGINASQLAKSADQLSKSG